MSKIVAIERLVTKIARGSGEEILDPFASKNPIRNLGQNGIDAEQNDAGTKNNAEDIAGGTRTTSRRGDNGNCDCDVSGDRKW